MKNIHKILIEIENDPIKANAIHHFPFIEETINEIIFSIKSCKNVDEAARNFNLLDQINFALAKLTFKENVIPPTTLRKFITDFDRIDDKQWRLYLFNKIKNNDYSLEGKPALYGPF